MFIYNVEVNNDNTFQITMDKYGSIIVDDNYKKYLYFMIDCGYFEDIEIGSIINEMEYHRESYFHIKNENYDMDMYIERCL